MNKHNKDNKDNKNNKNNRYNLIVNANILTYVSDKPIIKNLENSSNLIKLKNCSILFNDHQIIDIGTYKELKEKYNLRLVDIDNIIDVNNYWVFPGLIDCHTHLLFAGSRIDEFILRQKGYSYQDIAKSGGGIKYTVNQTTNESLQNLKKLLIHRLQLLKNYQTKIVEIKNGYAIDLDKELEHLKLIKEVSKQLNIIIIPTFLAHIPDDNFEYYLKKLSDNASKIRELTDYFDIFVDKTAFNLNQTLKILEILKDYNFRFRFHVNEFQDDGFIDKAIELFNDYNIVSFDHLLVLTDRNIENLRRMNERKSVFGVIMPSTSWFLAKNYANAKLLQENGIPICLATDYNAGSSNALSLQFVSNLAAIYLKLDIDDIFAYLTINPAFLLNLKAGQIRKGFLPIFSFINFKDYREFFFSLTTL
ncbi:MAG: amidohydrolase family protein [bacterium]|nr:amidohydrolase family protein [bacterium]